MGVAKLMQGKNFNFCRTAMANWIGESNKSFQGSMDTDDTSDNNKGTVFLNIS
ncbi:conserved hypothetical protein [Ricinus communis]|uniref:Uncharacterized protein n=1 Tax=Ricinus communis TaxID=3988 RepID=B9S2Y8_RICCO|nr:conserved hypothetical protein [Ricinus communis]